ncbi:MAG: hypothetical protein QOC85_1437, partial [Streptomyces sp.]|nr:hypothetical protein [Streptomyces sp.]
MGSIPAWARVYVACVVVAALAVVAPVTAIRTPWWAIALLAALYAGCEQITRCRFVGHRAPKGMGTFFPVLLAGAFLLPPPAAALVALPGALLSRVEQRPRRLRRIWRAAQLALGIWAASRVHWALGGRDAVVAPDFPYALWPAGLAVLAFCLVLTVLDGGILATAERVPVRTAWRGLFLRSLAPVTVHGLAGLMMAVLWRSPYGPVAALLVLLPMYVSC